MSQPVATAAADGDVIEVGLRLAPPVPGAAAWVRGLVDELSQEGPPRRVVGLGTDGPRVVVTLAVGLGTAEEIRSGSDNARAAVVYLHDLVERMSATDPALVSFPDASSVDAVIAHHVQTQALAYGLGPQVEEIRAEALIQAVNALAGVGVAVEP